MQSHDVATQSPNVPSLIQQVVADHRSDAGPLPSPAKTAAELIRDRSVDNPTTMTIDDFLPVCRKVWARTIDQHSSMDGYESTVRLHILPFFEGSKIADWERWLIQEFIERLDKTLARTAKGTLFKDQRKLSKSQKKRILAILSSICSIAIDHGLLQKNPAQNYTQQLKRYSEQGHARAKPIPFNKALTKDERDRLLLAARTVLDHQYFAYFHFLAVTGLRPSEAAALRWKHLDLEGGTTGGVPVVSVRSTIKRGERHIGKTKNKRWRTVELHAAAVKILAVLKATAPDNPDAFVFTRANGRPFLQTFRNQVWALVCGLAGLERWLPVYCLRHTYASILINEGASITFVSQQLGHYNDEVTRITYFHWLPIKSNPNLDRLRLTAE